MKYLLAFGFGMTLLWNTALAQQLPVLDFFHGRECPHCHNEKKWFPTLEKAYPGIVINEYEVWHDPQNQQLMRQRLQAIGAESTGVPTNIIGDQVITGFAPEQIVAALENLYGPPAVDIFAVSESEPGWWERLVKWLKQLFVAEVVEPEPSTVPPEGIHFHANFHLYVDGERFDFSGDEFMTASEACYGAPGRETESLQKFVHLHYNVGDVVHVHAEGITWQIFLESLGFGFSEDIGQSRVEFQEKNFATADLNFHSVSGEEVSLGNLIAPEDRVLIALGEAPVDLAEKLAAVPNNAPEYDEDQQECH